MKEKIILVGAGGIVKTTTHSVESVKERGVTIISNEPESIPFVAPKMKLEMPYVPPLTRKERRKLNRKK